MNTKLTLTMEKSVIEAAKKYAKNTGQSLSGMVENYFKLVSRNKMVKEKNEIEISPRVKSLSGSLPLPDDFDYKEELQKALEEKYL
jgi:hypothetical protein